MQPRIATYSDGQWTSAEEVRAEMDRACEEAGGVVDDALAALGFKVWAALGDDDFHAAPVSLRVYTRDTRPPHFLIQVRGSSSSGIHDAYAETLVDVMELLARWAPVVQAASMVELVRRFRAGELDEEAVDLLAGRAMRR